MYRLCLLLRIYDRTVEEDGGGIRENVNVVVVGQKVVSQRGGVRRSEEEM
jgi:hypothetical protein